MRSGGDSRPETQVQVNRNKIQYIIQNASQLINVYKSVPLTFFLSFFILNKSELLLRKEDVVTGHVNIRETLNIAKYTIIQLYQLLNYQQIYWLI